MTDFTRSLAILIGINDYQNGIHPLTTPVNDATRLAELLEQEHGYEVRLLVEDATKERMEALFAELKTELDQDDRLLLYFAGHGVALDGEDGPQGFLVLQDANPADRSTLLSMTDLHGWLEVLSCRHMLAILDCCFAGAFRWAATRNVGILPEVIHKERYDRFLRSPAWQVLTSAAYDQKALDLVSDRAVGARGIREDGGRPHSPFALALYDALQGEGDLIPKGGGDGVITAMELYLYLREQVEVGVEEAVGHEQTPGLWPLNKHGHGEYIFLTPGHQLNLPPAEPLTAENNPYRGLKSYEAKHRKVFFGRAEEIEALATQVGKQAFVAVLGASGTGKSSLVKAGLLPKLEELAAYNLLPPMRPSEQPTQALNVLLRKELGLGMVGTSPDALAATIAVWADSHPQQRLVLTIDQFEELVTLCADDADREQFLDLLANAVDQQPDSFRLIITLRTDFEPQFDSETPLTKVWRRARYVVPPMDYEDLRQVIEGPASAQVLYFDPPELVGKLIDEVIQTPGALPLLSFTLSEMYIRYLARQSDAQAQDEMIERSLTQADYDDLGGVLGSLRTRASQEFKDLPDEAHGQTMRRVMLRMVSVEGGELARRRVYRSELFYPTDEENQRVALVLERLVNARLLVTDGEGDQATVEPAHDALVRAWDKLLVWNRAAEAYLPLQRRVAQAATEWQSAAEDAKSGYLWDSDPRLPQLEDTLWPTSNGQKGVWGRLSWARQVLLPKTYKPEDTKWLNDAELAFVQESVKERAQFWRRTALGVSAFILVLVIATVVSVGLLNRAVVAETTAVAEAERAVTAETTAVTEAERAVKSEQVAISERDRADRNAADAEMRSQISRSRELAAESSVALAKNDYELAILLATESALVTGTVQSYTSIRNATAYPWQTTQIFYGHQGSVHKIRFRQPEKYRYSGR